MKKFICLLVVFSLLYLSACSDETQNDVIPTINETDESITTFGVIKCQDTINITLPFNAYIVNVHVKDGERVVQGQRLVELDASEYHTQINKKQEDIDNLKRQVLVLEDKLEHTNTCLSLSESNTQKAGFVSLEFDKQAAELQAKIDNMNVHITTLENEWSTINSYIVSEAGPEMEKLKSSLQYAQQEWRNARYDLRCIRELYEIGDISLHDYKLEVRKVEAKEHEIDNIYLSINALMQSQQNTANGLQISINQSNNDLAYMETALEYIKKGKKLSLESEAISSAATIQGYQIEIKELQASIKNINRLIALEESSLLQMKSYFKSDFIRDSTVICGMKTSIVYENKYTPGDIALAGNTILNLMNNSSIYVEVDIEEQSISGVSENALVHIVPESDKSRFYTGNISFKSAIASQKNGETMITVRISIDDADDFLIPNANVKVKIFPAK